MFNLILIYFSAGDGLFKPSKLLTSASTEFIYDGESLWTEIKTLRLQQGPNIFWYRFLLPPPPPPPGIGLKFGLEVLHL